MVVQGRPPGTKNKSTAARTGPKTKADKAAASAALKSNKAAFFKSLGAGASSSSTVVQLGTAAAEPEIAVTQGTESCASGASTARHDASVQQASVPITAVSSASAQNISDDVSDQGHRDTTQEQQQGHQQQQQQKAASKKQKPVPADDLELPASACQMSDHQRVFVAEVRQKIELTCKRSRGKRINGAFPYNSPMILPRCLTREPFPHPTVAYRHPVFAWIPEMLFPDDFPLGTPECPLCKSAATVKSDGWVPHVGRRAVGEHSHVIITGYRYKCKACKDSNQDQGA